jgi:hypothetical protein
LEKLRVHGEMFNRERELRALDAFAEASGTGVGAPVLDDV